MKFTAWMTVKLILLLTVLIFPHRVFCAQDAGGRQGGHLYVEPLSPVVVPCVVEESDLLVEAGLSLENSTVTWFHNHQLIDATSNSNYDQAANGSLIIGAFSASIHSGFFYCVIHLPVSSRHLTLEINQYLIRSRQITLSTIAEPASLDEQLSLSVSVGSTLILVCPVQNFTRTAGPVRWLHNDFVPDAYNDNRLILLPDGKLYVINVTTSESGRWSCEVDISGSSTTLQSYQISVSPTLPGDEDVVLDAPPERLDSPPYITEVTIPCFINPRLAASQHQTRWSILNKFNSWQPLPEADPTISIRPNVCLIISTASTSTPQKVKCEIVRSAGRQTEVISEFVTTLHRFTAPVITSQPSYKQVDVSTHSTLACGAQASPEASLIWLRNAVPLPLCHSFKVLSDGSLHIQYNNIQDSAIYQCVHTNAYGQAINTHILEVNLQNKTLSSLHLEISNASLVSSSSMRVNWLMCNPEEIPIMAVFINYAPTLCLPDSLIITQNSNPKQSCQNAPDSPSQEACRSVRHDETCECCSSLIEIGGTATPLTSVIAEVVGYTSIGATISSSFTVGKISNKTSKVIPQASSPTIPVIYDFGVALLAMWNHTELSSGYFVVLEQIFQQGDYTSQRNSFTRSKDHNYTIISGADLESLGPDMTISVEPLPSVPDQAPTRVYLTPRINPAGKPPSVYALLGTDKRDLSVFWSWSVDPAVNTRVPDVYILWYKCNSVEGLHWPMKSTNQFKIRFSTPPAYCDILLSGLMNGTAHLGALVRYDRWCQEVVAPYNLTILPVANLESRSFSRSIQLQWLPDSTFQQCEIDYLVQWKEKNSARPVANYPNQHKVKNANSVKIQNLRRDATYEISITVFTNSSSDQQKTAVISHTVGAPQSAENILLNQSKLDSGLVLVSWDTPRAQHDVSLYVCHLYVRLDRRWNRIDAVSAASDMRKAAFSNLAPHTWYNVTVSSINRFGAGGSSSVLFRTPACTSVPHCGSDPGQAPVILNDTNKAVVIGVCISIVFIFISAVIIILHKRRYASNRLKAETRHSERVPLEPQSANQQSNEGGDSGIGDWERHEGRDSQRLSSSFEEEDHCMTPPTRRRTDQLAYPNYSRSLVGSE